MDERKRVKKRHSTSPSPTTSLRKRQHAAVQPTALVPVVSNAKSQPGFTAPTVEAHSSHSCNVLYSRGAIVAAYPQQQHHHHHHHLQGGWLGVAGGMSQTVFVLHAAKNDTVVVQDASTTVTRAYVAKRRSFVDTTDVAIDTHGETCPMCGFCKPTKPAIVQTAIVDPVDALDMATSAETLDTLPDSLMPMTSISVQAVLGNTSVDANSQCVHAGHTMCVRDRQLSTDEEGDSCCCCCPVYFIPPKPERVGSSSPQPEEQLRSEMVHCLNRFLECVKIEKPYKIADTSSLVDNMDTENVSKDANSPDILETASHKSREKSRNKCPCEKLLKGSLQKVSDQSPKKEQATDKSKSSKKANGSAKDTPMSPIKEETAAGSPSLETSTKSKLENREKQVKAVPKCTRIDTSFTMASDNRVSVAIQSSFMLNVASECCSSCPAVEQRQELRNADKMECICPKNSPFASNKSDATDASQKPLPPPAEERLAKSKKCICLDTQLANCQSPRPLRVVECKCLPKSQRESTSDGKSDRVKPNETKKSSPVRSKTKLPKDYILDNFIEKPANYPLTHDVDPKKGAPPAKPKTNRRKSSPTASKQMPPLYMGKEMPKAQAPSCLNCCKRCVASACYCGCTCPSPQQGNPTLPGMLDPCMPTASPPHPCQYRCCNF